MDGLMFQHTDIHSNMHTSIHALDAHYGKKKTNKTSGERLGTCKNKAIKNYLQQFKKILGCFVKCKYIENAISCNSVSKNMSQKKLGNGQ